MFQPVAPPACSIAVRRAPAPPLYSLKKKAARRIPAVDLRSDGQERPICSPGPIRKLILSRRFSIQRPVSPRALQTVRTPRLNPSRRSLIQRPGPPAEEAFRKPFRKPARKAPSRKSLRKPLRDVPPRKTPFGAFRSMTRVPKNPFRSHPEALPNAPSKPSSEPPSKTFGECQVSRKLARKPPFRNLLLNPPFGLSFGKCHVSQVPIHIGPSRKPPSAPRVQRVILPPEASECDTCLEYPSRESSSGCHPSSPRVPSARAERPLPGTF